MNKSPSKSISTCIIVNLLGLDSGGGLSIVNALAKYYICYLSDCNVKIIGNKSSLLSAGFPPHQVYHSSRALGILSDQIYIFCILLSSQKYNNRVILLNFSDIPVLTLSQQILFFDWAYAVSPPAMWGKMSLKDKLFKVIKKTCFQVLSVFVDHYICQTAYMKNCLISHNLRHQKITINPIGIPALVEELSASKKSAPFLNNHSANDIKHIIFCPNLPNSHKGFDHVSRLISSNFLLDSSSLLVLLVNQARANILFADSCKDSISRQVVFLGPVSKSQMIKLYNSSCVVLNPSQLESFGFAYYEAAILGVRQVVPRLPHVPKFALKYSYQNNNFSDMIRLLYLALCDYQENGPLNPSRFRHDLQNRSQESIKAFLSLIKTFAR
jgi:hypothetical protein